MQIIPIKEVCRRVGLCRTTVWQLIRDGKFPKLVRLTEKRKGFVDEEIDDWISARIAERDAEAA
ncbi:AlpA family phage regulatory protein [Mesorhizobium mediterraneum]|uniref:AlpA family transcriptional regulator n=1 Tax=Mesorhizobium mediterraneum TaxID=43617 RepID=A0AB36QZW1_9HYPH|nr:AlpA family phage regulatory protein [Mesorhizobium mediterraneum]PAP97807.1 hypothetical protein CIT25_35055 [Mesorhizobium mediterraneum]WIW52038.1 AlpA family phage regulatory protein [Mesorhizobium mediterraneum]